MNGVMIKEYALILLCLTLFSACDKIVTPALAGKWQLKTVEKNGVETAVDTVWYNFQSESVFTLQVYVPQQDTFLESPGLKKQDNKVLSIRLEFDTHIEYSDWTDRERSFTIEHLNRKKLILRSEEGYHYSFIKF
ncbi:MAG: hypothetical protein LBC19_08430 [Tannerella sp.]|jgi:hypothetical protein|nr:hypothetical protein [Tannerella sp.]